MVFRLLLQLPLLLVLWSSATGATEASDDDKALRSGINAGGGVGFASARSVEGELAETTRRQEEGPLAEFRDSKRRLEASTGLAYGFDNNTQYLGTDSDRSPSDSAGNVVRLYGTWTATGRGTPDNGAVVFKVEYRSAIGDNISTQALGPSLGYAGLFSSTFSDAGVVLTNLYWRQQFADERGTFVIGQVDPSDYISVNSEASPWTAFTNLALEQQPTLPIPSQGLGTAVQWRLNDSWAILGGIADANGDPSEPWESARNLEASELFKHFAIGWSPDWAERYNQALQLAFWQVDKRKEAGVDGGHGVSFTASGRVENWSPFLRLGYAKDAGAALDRAISIGTGYDARGGKDLAGLGVNWGRSPDNSRDQFTLEAFYRHDMTDFLQLTPEIQYIIHPANDPATSDILVVGLRLRIFF